MMTAPRTVFKVVKALELTKAPKMEHMKKVSRTIEAHKIKDVEENEMMEAPKTKEMEEVPITTI